MTEPLLETRGLTKNFRGLMAVRDHNIKVNPGEIVGIIGPNGSGKSTFFNLISGFSKPSEGEVLFKGRTLSGLSPAAVVRHGLARTFQGSRVFRSLSVRDNIAVAAQLRNPTNIFESILLIGRHASAQSVVASNVEKLLRFVGLEPQAERLASELAYGDQRRLEIARSLATSPDLLLLDEPAAGLDSRETKDLGDLIRAIRDKLGVTVIVVEHDMDLIMNLCERIQVLAAGEIVCTGSAEEVRTNTRVREVYLGHE